MKYKSIFITTISIIYSSCAFSNILSSKSPSDFIISEYEEPKVRELYSSSDFFNQIVDDNLIRIVKGTNKEVYGIEINSSIVKDLEKYLRNHNLTNSADLVKNNIINKNGYIEIQPDNNDLKIGIVNYLSEKNLLTTENNKEVINQIQHTKTMIYNIQDSPLSLGDLGSPERTNKIINNINAKNRSLFLLEKNTKQDLAQISELQKQDYALLRNLVSDNNQRLSENHQDNAKKIKNNKTDIDKNTHDIERNTNNIRENRTNINDIKENYIDNLDVNGNNISLKSHFATLYTEQSLSRNEFKTLKNNFEHFKSDTQNRFYKVEKRANQGIASVAAMSNLPFTDTATFSTAIGIGNYRNATALAWGMQYRINENVKVRASTAWNESNSWVSAGGVGVSW
ncbi:YadA-like family protein [Proteus cibi]|uniref:YadA-like family protein n=1 Tax=Proteus cibi TaxID=2050966 RepID=A0ABU6EHV7_9GAMM|nr:YadA C-terminal domain-containing protein [Proteus cibi]MEB6858512.1 YadA-like family protein [Proteus cibi]MEB7090065.1 YadA-like family protein [Proteus cibi]